MSQKVQDKNERAAHYTPAKIEICNAKWFTNFRVLVASMALLSTASSKRRISMASSSTSKIEGRANLHDGTVHDQGFYHFQIALSLFFIGGLLTGFVIGEGPENLGFQFIGGLVATLIGKIAKIW